MLFDDEFFWLSLRVTLKYTIVAVPLTLAGAFAVSMLLNTKVRGMSFFRTVYYLPSVVPVVASVMLWRWIFNTDFGLLNVFLKSLGVPKIRWLFDTAWVMPAFWLMALWGIGPWTVIFLAGLQGVPRTLYEAAEIDGAGVWGKFRHVTIPQMSPVMFYNFVMGIIWTFQVFTAGYLLTGGGPENATLFYVLYTYRNAFSWFKTGYAASLAWVLFLIILVMTALVFRFLQRRVYYETA
jgi:multiple sugar transport system permease protein